MSDAIITTISHHELVFVGPGGSNTWCFGYQPTTDDIARTKKKADRYCIQKIGELYEVYDLTTLKPAAKWALTNTIGLPVFIHKDADAAIMWALMNL